MKLADFQYELPEELIAQEPLADRAASRMLVLHRAEGRWEDCRFRDLPQYLHPGDCLVLNNSKVFPSRLFGRRLGVFANPVGLNNPHRHEHLTGQVQIFLLRPLTPDQQEWEALVRPGRKMQVGEKIDLGEGLQAEITARGDRGVRTVRFQAESCVRELLYRLGHVPLPPYIKRQDQVTDRERYQTVYAEQDGSAAAPTAGLHFTPEVLEKCREAGAEIARVTLHVGLGTFQPLDVENVEDGKLHSESYAIGPEAAAAIARAQRRIAVGTTSARTMESAAQNGPINEPVSGDTSLYIYPGYQFRAVDAMLTNFHLPSSSLLLLVSAFGGTELVRAAYEHAVKERYRFFSYGDCMLIL